MAQMGKNPRPYEISLERGIIVKQKNKEKKKAKEQLSRPLMTMGRSDMCTYLEPIPSLINVLFHIFLESTTKKTQRSTKRIMGASTMALRCTSLPYQSIERYKM
jgi:hypothetical protein